MMFANAECLCHLHVLPECSNTGTDSERVDHRMEWPFYNFLKCTVRLACQCKRTKVLLSQFLPECEIGHCSYHDTSVCNALDRIRCPEGGMDQHPDYGTTLD